jgi:membrane protein YqaA with SNARE-associated domain
MSRLAAWFQSFALSIGGPGIFVIAFLDSSFLSLPQINDLLIIWMVVQHPARMPYYAALATLGSIAGCLVMYWLARKGGELFLRRFSERRLAWARGLFSRYGFLAVVVPALLPPPAPFKLFVLLAGVAGMPAWSFVLAVALGRGIRYFGEGVLAVLYGEQAIDFVRAHARGVSLGLGLTVLAGGLVWFLWRRWRPDAPVPRT